MTTFNSVIRSFQLKIPLLGMIVILMVGLIPGPQILGVWESYYFFHIFDALHSTLGFLISPRANIADPGYGLLEISRNIITFFGLGLKLETFRIPAILFGGISIFLFFIIARRYFGKWAALAATAMLAVNPMFHQQQHTITVLIVSGMAFLFLIERFQALEYQYNSLTTWSGLAVAAMLVALHYGVGRILMVFLLILWFAKVYIIIGLKPDGKLVLRTILEKFFLVFQKNLKLI